MKRPFHSKHALVVLVVLAQMAGVSWGWAGLLEKRAAKRATCAVLDPHGRDGTLRLDFEYSLNFLRTHYPGGNGTLSFAWASPPEGTTARTEHLVRSRDSDFYLLTFSREPAADPHRLGNTAVILLRESSPGYFRPVFIALTEEMTFSGKLLSNRKHPLAYSVHMSQPGSGAFVWQYLFDLRSPSKLIASAAGHRLDGDPRDKEYKRALAEMQADLKRASGE